jgi:hypothetical protein
MNTTEQTASIVELHSSVIRGIIITLVSEQSTEVSKKTCSFLGCGRENSGEYVSTSTSKYVRNQRSAIFWHVPSSRHKGRLLWIMLTLVRIDDNVR